MRLHLADTAYPLVADLHTPLNPVSLLIDRTSCKPSALARLLASSSFIIGQRSVAMRARFSGRSSWHCVSSLPCGTDTACRGFASAQRAFLRLDKLAARGSRLRVSDVSTEAGASSSSNQL
eukprot:4565240-Prymnesium_polylepis.2